MKQTLSTRTWAAACGVLIGCVALASAGAQTPTGSATAASVRTALGTVSFGSTVLTVGESLNSAEQDAAAVVGKLNQRAAPQMKHHHFHGAKGPHHVHDLLLIGIRAQALDKQRVRWHVFGSMTAVWL